VEYCFETPISTQLHHQKDAKTPLSIAINQRVKDINPMSFIFKTLKAELKDCILSLKRRMGK